MRFDLTPLRGEYPWESRWFDRKGLAMHYLDEGQGDPVVMIHGNPTWSFYWRKLVAGLSSTQRCIVPDHIGMGLSDVPDDDTYAYTLQSRVDDLEALLDHLKVSERLTLVVHDWGGMIGLAYATRHPERIRRLVVLNTAGFGLPQGRALPWQLALIRYLPMGGLVRGLNAFSRGAVLTCSTRPGMLTDTARKAYLLPYNSWHNRIAVHRFVQDIPLKPGDPAWDIVADVSARLDQWKQIPVLVLWGEKDFVFDLHFLAEWKRRLPTAEFHSFPDVGHYIMEDAGAEVLQHVHSFLDRNPIS